MPGMQDEFGNEQLFCDCTEAIDAEGNTYGACKHSNLSNLILFKNESCKIVSHTLIISTQLESFVNTKPFCFAVDKRETFVSTAGLATPIIRK